MRLSAEYLTETFINRNGYYAIKQESWNGEPAVIELSPSQMRALIRDMRARLADSDDWFDPAEEG